MYLHLITTAFKNLKKNILKAKIYSKTWIKISFGLSWRKSSLIPSPRNTKPMAHNLTKKGGDGLGVLAYRVTSYKWPCVSGTL